MSVLGPGAACCQQSDCDIECGFKSAAPAVEPAPLVVPDPVTATPVDATLTETPKVDSTDKPAPDVAPEA